MKKNIELAKRISQNLEKNWEEDFRELNIWYIFKPIFNLYGTKSSNTISCFIIYSYDNDSAWLNYRQDREENKKRILTELGATPSAHPFKEIREKANEEINDVIAVYLQSQVTSQWGDAMAYLDYAEETRRMATKKTESEKTLEKMNKEGEIKEMTSEIDIDKILKAQATKSDLLDKAVEATKKARAIIEEIGKEFLELNQAVQMDFGFEPASEKSIHYEEWRDWVRNYAVPYRKRQKEEDAKKAAKK